MKLNLLIYVLIIYFCSFLLTSSQAYLVVIEPHGQECYFEKVFAGTKMGLTFEVMDGGFRDIDIFISGPEGRLIHREDKVSSGKYTFAAHADGAYYYCFGNSMSTLTSKTVMFSMIVGEIFLAPKDNEAPKQKLHVELEKELRALYYRLVSVQIDQEFTIKRDEVHRAINESTNQRVMLWALFEGLLLVAMTLGQIFYLQRFFEVRRGV